MLQATRKELQSIRKILTKNYFNTKTKIKF